MKGKSPMTKALVGKQNNLPEELKAKIEAAPESSPMKKDKFYGDRSRKDMRQDIREERKSLKENGGSRGDVKEYNQYQRSRKKDIRSEVKAKQKTQPIAQGADKQDKKGDRKARKTKR